MIRVVLYGFLGGLGSGIAVSVLRSVYRAER
jgi:hypothetical protein